MSYRVILLESVAGQTEVTIPTLNIVDGILWKGTKYGTPVSNIKYIEEI